MFKILSIFLFFSAAQLYAEFGPPSAISPPTTIGPGHPTFLQVGTLSCAARMYTPTMLQTWCFKDTALKSIAINSISDVSFFGFRLLISDATAIDPGTTLEWVFLPTEDSPPIVSWTAIITKNSNNGFPVVSPVLTGVL